MTHYNIDITTLCNPHGAWFLYMFKSIRTTPLALWIVLGGFAYTTREWYFFAMSNTYLLLYIIQPIFGHLTGDSLLGVATKAPHQYCNNASYIGPVLEVILLYVFVTQALINLLWFRLPLNWIRVLWKLVLLVGIPVLFVYSGNASIGQVVQGAVAGALIGSSAMYFILFILMPLFQSLEHVWFCANVLGMHNCRDIRLFYYRDMLCHNTDGKKHGITRNKWLSYILMM